MMSPASGRPKAESFFLYLLGGGRAPAQTRRAQARRHSEANAVRHWPALARVQVGDANANEATPQPGEAPPAKARKTQ